MLRLSPYAYGNCACWRSLPQPRKPSRSPPASAPRQARFSGNLHNEKDNILKDLPLFSHPNIPAFWPLFFPPYLVPLSACPVPYTHLQTSLLPDINLIGNNRTPSRRRSPTNGRTSLGANQINVRKEAHPTNNKAIISQQNPSGRGVCLFI